jgi:hypothetical protein
MAWPDGQRKKAVQITFDPAPDFARDVLVEAIELPARLGAARTASFHAPRKAL